MSVPSVKIFPTQVVSDEALQLYSQYSIVDVYSRFYTSSDPTELSVLLYLICLNEKNMRSRLLGTFNPDQVEYSNFDGFNNYSISSTRIRDNISALRDPHFRDIPVFVDTGDMREYQPYAVVAFLDSIYWGHVYMWPVEYSPRQYVVNVMGIRTSIFGLIHEMRGMAIYLLSAIRKYASMLDADFAFVRILSPFKIMQEISLRIGMMTPKEFASLYPELDWVQGIYLDKFGNYMHMDETFYVGEGSVSSEEESYDHSSDRLIEFNRPLINEPDFRLDIL